MSTGLPAYPESVLENERREYAPPATTRWPHVALVVVGLALIVAPLVLGMFTRAAQGQQMLASFAPYATQQQLNGFRGDLAVLADARANVIALQSNGQAPNGQYHYLHGFVRDYPAIESDVGSMIGVVEHNLPRYDKLTQLPPFGLLPWLFALPGAALTALGVVGFRRASRGKSTTVHLVAAALVGVFLVVFPVASGIFDKAPAGSGLVADFRPLLTTERVRTVQGYFVTLVGGQGELDSRFGREVRANHPDADLRGVDALTTRWQALTADFAGFVGVLNDNIENFDGVVAMGDSTEPLGFDAFHGLGWFYLIPGVVIVLIAGQQPVRAALSRRTEKGRHDA